MTFLHFALIVSGNGHQVANAFFWGIALFSFRFLFWLIDFWIICCYLFVLLFTMHLNCVAYSLK